MADANGGLGVAVLVKNYFLLFSPVENNFVNALIPQSGVSQDKY